MPESLNCRETNIGQNLVALDMYLKTIFLQIGNHVSKHFLSFQPSVRQFHMYEDHFFQEFKALGNIPKNAKGNTVHRLLLFKSLSKSAAQSII